MSGALLRADRLRSAADRAAARIDGEAVLYVYVIVLGRFSLLFSGWDCFIFCRYFFAYPSFFIQFAISGSCPTRKSVRRTLYISAQTRAALLSKDYRATRPRLCGKGIYNSLSFGAQICAAPPPRVTRASHSDAPPPKYAGVTSASSLNRTASYSDPSPRCRPSSRRHKAPSAPPLFLKS